jgi:hypothetical protein
MPVIPRKLRQEVIRNAGNRCEYCLTSQDLTLATFHIDHILARSAKGKTAFENLCLSCPFCNLYKKGRISARDVKTGRQVRLYNPRRDQWRKHFRWAADGLRIIGLTGIGRATIDTLRMNNDISINARRLWVASKIHPPTDF